ncbi:MAG: hypothetical protein K9K67_00380 [Bacteriovoracaceae bacterium]|nr:hypothetical protein [Bacteriovoracaceae bacterium]
MKEKQNKFIFLMLVLVLTLTSCGGKGKTQAKLNITVGNIASPQLTPFVGGAILMGSSNLGDSFAVNLIDQPGPVSLNLRNAEWKFQGFLWDGAGDGDGNPELEGAVKCADSAATLDGGELNIALNFSNANCANTKFSPVVNNSAGVISFPEIKIESCADASGASLSTHNCTLRSPGLEKGYFGSFRVVFETHDNTGSIPNVGFPLYSDCLAVSSANGSAIDGDANPMNIPVGNGTIPLKVRIEAFDDVACAGTRAFTERPFNKGLFIPDGQSVLGVKSISGGTNPALETKLFFVAPGEAYCNNSYAYSFEFSGGDGSANSPFAICDAYQWDLIGDTATDGAFTLSANYALLRNINFQGREKLLGVDPLACVDIRMPSNFVPVGYDCSTATMTGTFSGTFYGNNKQISNPIFFDENLSNIGLFSQSSGSIYDLNIVNIQIEGGDYVGALVGNMTGGVAENISLFRGEIRSRTDTGIASNTGGLVGSLATGTLQDIIIQNIEIEANNNNVGGIVGSINTTSITNGYFNGLINVEGKQDNTNSSGIGGIAGSVSGATVFTRVISKGLVSANAIKVGGIAGDHTGASGNMVDSYSQMALVSYFNGTGINLGGLIGFGTSFAVDNSYFSGSINHYCNDGTTSNCTIGGIAGTGAVGLANTHSTESLGGTYGGQDGANVIDDDPTSGLALRNIVSFPITSFASGDAVWDVVQGRFPRLDWELAKVPQPCNLPENFDTVANQMANGRGNSEINPIRICNNDQFKDIAANASMIYRLEDHINLDFIHSGNDTNVIGSFFGALDGNGRVLHGGAIVSGADQELGLIRVVEAGAIVKDLNIVSLSVTRNGGTTNGGLGSLAGINNGTLYDISSNFSDVDGSTGMSKVGGVVGINNGDIEEIYSSSSISGDIFLGGIVGYNTGTIEKVRSSFYFSPLSGPVSGVIGGVVGQSLGGTISKVSFDGEISLSQTFTVSHVGGLVGRSVDTVIEDSYSEDHAKIIVMDGSIVGGLVGSLNNSTLVTSYNSAEVRYGYCTGGGSSGFEISEYDCKNNGSPGTWNLPGDPTNYGAVAGESINGSSIGPKVFFTNPAYQIIQIGLTPSTNTVSAANCQVDLGTAVTAPSGTALTNPIFDVGSGRGIFIGKHNKYFDITAEPTASQVFVLDFDIGTSSIATDCTDLTAGSYWDPESNGVSLTVVGPSGNTLGTQAYDLEMTDPNTFCDDGFTGGNDYFVCSSGWDIVEDTTDRNNDSIDGDFGDGFLRVIDYYLSSLFDEPKPLDVPAWSIEPNKDRYPRHINN